MDTNALGFAKPAAATRVVVAMSGGVDSSVAAAVLKAQGFDVVGITLQLYDHGVALQKKGACCAGQDIYDAAMAAERIGIPHYVLDYERRFRDAVMADFAESYARGETPIPCVRCNERVKFRDLLDQARELDADCLATGHYVQRLLGAGGRAELHAGADPTRDQSYFLFTTTRDQLDYLRFPLGDLPKTQTRALAAEFGLEVAQKPDSQDICFVPTGNYAELVGKMQPQTAQAGEIVDEAGQVLGSHGGIARYTVGQRKGLGLGGGVAEDGKPLFVLKLDARANRVVVGPREKLAVSRVALRDVNWLADATAEAVPVSVKLRSAQPAVPGQVRLGGGRGAELVLDTPALGVSPGQAAVFYDGSRVLGGGWIAEAA